MIQLNRGLVHARPRLLAEAERLEHLAADLRSVAEGLYPSPSDIVDSPVLHRWRYSERRMPSLIGTGSGYPRLPIGLVHTTEIWAIDLEARWARTLSRLYVLAGERPDAS